MAEEELSYEELFEENLVLLEEKEKLAVQREAGACYDVVTRERERKRKGAFPR